MAQAGPDLALIGNKAAGLCTLAVLGLPVPPGFVLTSNHIPLPDELTAAVKKLEKNRGEGMGPLLLAVRSSPAERVLGFQETILGIGLNDETVLSLAQFLNDEDRAFSLYAQFIADYAVHVLRMDPEDFEAIAEDHDLSPKKLAERYKQLLESNSPAGLPSQLLEQLQRVLMVSATRPRIVQRTVFFDRAPGVAHSRQHATGISFRGDAPLTAQFPQQAEILKEALIKLEHYEKAPQQIDYCLAQGKVWLLQCRPARLSAAAELKFLVDMVEAKVLSREEALLRIDPFTLDQFLHPMLDPTALLDFFTSGIAASPGAVSGCLVFSASEAHQKREQGHDVILLRHETSPEDIQAMHVSAGIITVRGGLLSHAAMIARGMGKPCVVGASSLRIDDVLKTVMVGDRCLRSGDVVTIDGATGKIFVGAVATVKPVLSGDFATVLVWADGVRRMAVRANAETAHDARTALYFGAEGIGLCRTEHMFFSPERIGTMRRMILAETVAERRAVLSDILPMQRQDIIELFEIMAGLPVTIRLLDPPLHEFLPKSIKDIDALAEELAMPVDKVRRRVAELQEFNPMLGHRGVRLAISYPEIVEMQARAIFEASIFVRKKHGLSPVPEIMVPLVIGRPELDFVRGHIARVAEEVKNESGFDLHYLVGAMIELPRAALRAGDIAQSADFLSFGTNDLTQTTLGISRDDSARFIGEYTTKGLMPRDPFMSLDIAGVGELISLAAQRGRDSNPELKLGICGEHGGDPASIRYCDSINLDYVSCSPFRIAVARLAAAQASIRKN